MMTTTSPLLTERSTPFNTCVAPKCLCTPRASTTAAPVSIVSARIGGDSHVGHGRTAAVAGDRARGIGLEATLDQAPYRRQEEIVERRDDEDLQHLELDLHQKLGAAQQFLHRDHRGKRRSLHQTV